MIAQSIKPIGFLLFTGVLFAAGCKQQAAAPSSSTAGSAAPAPVYGVRNPDGSITNPNGSVTYPPGSSVAQRAEGPTAAPTQGAAQGPAQGPAAQGSAGQAMSGPAPSSTGGSVAAPAAVPLVVPAHTAVSVRLTTSLAASRNEVGDRWTGVLEAPIVVHGSQVFRAGTPVSGEVVSSKGKGRFKGAGDLGISVTAIGRDRVETSVYEKEAKGRGKRTAGFIGGGAGLGALIGGLAGGGKGALIGGLAGGGAGTAAGAYTGNRDVILPSESVVTFRLTQSLRR